MPRFIQFCMIIMITNAPKGSFRHLCASHTGKLCRMRLLEQFLNIQLQFFLCRPPAVAAKHILTPG